MCERMKVPVPRAASSPSGRISRASPTKTRRLPLDPAPLGDHRPGLQRPGEDQVEGGGQQEAVADHRIAGVEGGIVHHLEIERAVRRAGGVEAWPASTSKRIRAKPGSAISISRFEQGVDRARRGRAIRARGNARPRRRPRAQAASRASAPASKANSASFERAPRSLATICAVAEHAADPRPAPSDGRRRHRAATAAGRRDRPAGRRSTGNRPASPAARNSRTRARQPLDLAVRDRGAAAEAGRADLLARVEAGDDRLGR